MQKPSNRRVEKETTEARNSSDMSYEDRAALALIKVVILYRRGAGALERERIRHRDTLDGEG